MNGYLQDVVGAEDCFAEIALGIRLVDRSLDPASRLGVLAPYVDKGVVNLVGDRGDDDPLDHLVGVTLQKLAVFERPGLRLIGVDDEVGGSCRGQEAPLEAGGECRTSAAEQTGHLDLFDELVASQSQGPLALRITPCGLVPGDGVRVARMVDHPPCNQKRCCQSAASLPTVPRGWKAG